MTVNDEGNPYMGLLEAFRAEGSKLPGLTLRIGQVIATDPLTVRIGGTDQTGNALWLAERLKENHTREVDFEGALRLTEAEGRLYEEEEEYGSSLIVHSGHLSGKITGELTGTLQEILSPGDRVLCLSADDQEFYLLDKVVRP